MKGLEIERKTGSKKRLSLHLLLLAILLGAFLTVFTQWNDVLDSWRFEMKYQVEDKTAGRCSSNVWKNSADYFDWKALYPSVKLRWAECYEMFQCARLEVPLDYAKPHEEKAAVALIRFPSRYDQHDSRWKGPILYNFGGPGRSGVANVLMWGAIFSKIVGDDYDHVGFDPRGVGQTTPVYSLFENEAEKLIYEVQRPKYLNISNDEELNRWMSYTDVIGELGKRRGWMGKYVSSSIVAKDMMSIVRAFGREKLSYWGFSYGAVLGATFASMFPDRIERMIIDGVDDAYDYYKGLWSTNLVDTDQAYRNTLSACVSSPNCAFYDPNSTTEKLYNRIKEILDRVHERPLSVTMTTSDGKLNYGIVDRELARMKLFLALYAPRKAMLPWFDAVKNLEKDDGRKMLEISEKRDSLFRCDCGSPEREGRRAFEFSSETEGAIACSDASEVGKDFKMLKGVHEGLRDTSEFAEFWLFSLVCSGWKTKAVDRYSGKIEGNTSHPILMIGNTADPITPLEAAKQMSGHFPGSVVLTQNSTGHCSISAPSLCTAKYIREYFQYGTLPPKDMVCQVDMPMFDDKYVFWEEATYSIEELELREAVKRLSDGYEVPRFGMMN